MKFPILFEIKIKISGYIIFIYILCIFMTILIGKKNIHKSFNVVHEPHRQFPIGPGFFFTEKESPGEMRQLHLGSLVLSHNNRWNIS